MGIDRLSSFGVKDKSLGSWRAGIQDYLIRCKDNTLDKFEIGNPSNFFYGRLFGLTLPKPSKIMYKGSLVLNLENEPVFEIETLPLPKIEDYTHQLDSFREGDLEPEDPSSLLGLFSEDEIVKLVNMGLLIEMNGEMLKPYEIEIKRGDMLSSIELVYSRQELLDKVEEVLAIREMKEFLLSHFVKLEKTKLHMYSVNRMNSGMEEKLASLLDGTLDITESIWREVVIPRIFCYRRDSSQTNNNSYYLQIEDSLGHKVYIKLNKEISDETLNSIRNLMTKNLKLSKLSTVSEKDQVDLREFIQVIGLDTDINNCLSINSILREYID